MIRSVGACLLAALSGCGDDPKPAPPAAPISLPPVRSRPPASGALPPGHPAIPPAHGQGAPAVAPLKWTGPEGWTPGPERPVRLVSFVPKGRPGVDCSITVLEGDGGGFEENVKRWRQQLQLPPLPAEDVAKLPSCPMLGGNARLVEMDAGTAGMSVAVRETGERTVFVKMTGPPEDLKAERDRFLEFCSSLEWR